MTLYAFLQNFWIPLHFNDLGKQPSGQQLAVQAAVNSPASRIPVRAALAGAISDCFERIICYIASSRSTWLKQDEEPVRSERPHRADVKTAHQIIVIIHFGSVSL